jgi:flagellar basal body-associated protein FliL
MALVVGVTISTVAGSFIMFMLYLRPVLKAAEKASTAAERAAQEMETAAKVRCAVAAAGHG